MTLTHASPARVRRRPSCCPRPHLCVAGQSHATPRMTAGVKECSYSSSCADDSGACGPHSGTVTPGWAMTGCAEGWRSTRHDTSPRVFSLPVARLEVRALLAPPAAWPAGAGHVLASHHRAPARPVLHPSSNLALGLLAFAPTNPSLLHRRRQGRVAVARRRTLAGGRACPLADQPTGAVGTQRMCCARRIQAILGRTCGQAGVIGCPQRRACRACGPGAAGVEAAPLGATPAAMLRQLGVITGCLLLAHTAARPRRRRPVHVGGTAQRERRAGGRVDSRVLGQLHCKGLPLRAGRPRLQASKRSVLAERVTGRKHPVGQGRVVGKRQAGDWGGCPGGSVRQPRGRAVPCVLDHHPWRAWGRETQAAWSGCAQAGVSQAHRTARVLLGSVALAPCTVKCTTCTPLAALYATVTASLYPSGVGPLTR